MTTHLLSFRTDSAATVTVQDRDTDGKYVPSKYSCPLIIGSSLFSKGLKYSPIYFSGTFPGWKMFGTARYCPVIGGLRPSTRDSCERIPAISPPTDAPPTMKPFDGSELNLEALVANHFVTSQQSFVDVGKWCSGASL